MNVSNDDGGSGGGDNDDDDEIIKLKYTKKGRVCLFLIATKFEQEMKKINFFLHYTTKKKVKTRKELGMGEGEGGEGGGWVGWINE